MVLAARGPGSQQQGRADSFRGGQHATMDNSSQYGNAQAGSQQLVRRKGVSQRQQEAFDGQPVDLRMFAESSSNDLLMVALQRKNEEEKHKTRMSDALQQKVRRAMAWLSVFSSFIIAAGASPRNQAEQKRRNDSGASGSQHWPHASRRRSEGQICRIRKPGKQARGKGRKAWAGSGEGEEVHCRGSRQAFPL